MQAAATIIIDLFIIFVAAKLAGVVFTLIKQPPVVGELLAGILIGPFALGLVGIAQPALIADFQGQSESAQEALDLTLDTFAEIGAVILLFYVGLETRLSDLLNVGRRAILSDLSWSVRNDHAVRGRLCPDGTPRRPTGAHLAPSPPYPPRGIGSWHAE